MGEHAVAVSGMGCAVHSRTAKLVDLIHRAAAGQRSWRGFLHEVSNLAPEGRAILVYRDAASGGGRFVLAAGFERDVSEAFASYYAPLNPMRGAVVTQPVGEVMTNDQLISPRLLRRTEFYNDFLKPLGIETTFGVTLRREETNNYIFTLAGPALKEAERERVRRSVRALVPALQHACQSVRARAFGTRAEALFSQLRCDAGILLLGAQAKVHFCDALAREFLEGLSSIRVGPAGRLMTSEPTLRTALADALAHWNSGIPFSRVVFVRRQEPELPLRTTVLRPSFDEAAFFHGCHCVVIMEDIARGLAPAVETFGDMNGLTPAERRVVLGLCQGYAVGEIAALAGTASETVRRQLKKVYARAGLSGQVDLVRHVCLMAAGRKW